MDDLYAENILENYKNPQNKGILKNPDIVVSESNPLCGDVVSVYLKFKDGRVFDISFMGSGCAISQASASILSEFVKDRSLDEIGRLDEGDIVKLLGINISPVRMRCATLALEAIKKGVEKYGEE